MATIDNIPQGLTGNPARQYRKDAYLLKGQCNFATATTTKGSALASGDIIQCVQIPSGGVYCFGGYVSTVTATTGSTSSDLHAGWTENVTAILGSTSAAQGGTVGFKIGSASNVPTIFPTQTAGTIKINSVQNTITAGLVEFGLLIVDISTP